MGRFGYKGLQRKKQIIWTQMESGAEAAFFISIDCNNIKYFIGPQYASLAFTIILFFITKLYQRSHCVRRGQAFQSSGEQ